MMITDPEDAMVIAAMNYGRDGKSEANCLTSPGEGCTHTDCYYAGLLNRAMEAGGLPKIVAEYFEMKAEKKRREDQRSDLVKKLLDTSPSTVKWANFGWLELCLIENLLTHDDGVDHGPPPEEEFVERRLWQEIQDEKASRPEAQGV